MKILHVVQAYAPSFGGVQLLVQQLSERMSAQYGDQVTVYTTTAYRCQLFQDARESAMPPGVEQINGVTVRRFAVFNRLTWLRLNAARVAYKLRLPGQDCLRTLYFGPLVPGLTKAVAGSDADVVSASSFPMRHMYAALRGGRRAGIPVVLIGTIHPADTWSYDLPIIRRAIGQADAYVALSRFERDYLLDRGTAPERVSIVGAGVEAAAFDSEEGRAAGREMRQRHGWGDDDPVVAIVGRQTEYKRIDLALRAIQHVWCSVPSARLLIAGARTGYSDRIDKMLAALPPDERARVTVIEDFDEAEKLAIYHACDLLIQPSERESFGIVFLEAWASGKPVIGARVGAVPYVIDEGRDGLLAAYGDVVAWAQAIERLLVNPALRAEMGTRGRQKVLNHYTWDIVTRRFREIYVRASERAERANEPMR